MKFWHLFVSTTKKSKTKNDGDESGEQKKLKMYTRNQWFRDHLNEFGREVDWDHTEVILSVFEVIWSHLRPFEAILNLSKFILQDFCNLLSWRQFHIQLNLNWVVVRLTNSANQTSSWLPQQQWLVMAQSSSEIKFSLFFIFYFSTFFIDGTGTDLSQLTEYQIEQSKPNGTERTELNWTELNKSHKLNVKLSLIPNNEN